MFRAVLDLLGPLVKPLMLGFALLVGLALASTDSANLRSMFAAGGFSSAVSCRTPVIGIVCGLRDLLR